MFDASKNLALKCQPSYFSVHFLDMDGLINQYAMWWFVGKNYPMRTFHGQNQKNVYTRLYLNKLESIMRALSDALPTGHRAMANPTLQLHFGCGRATPIVSHSHNWPSGRMQFFLFKIGQKSYFFANKDPKTNFDAWMILQKPVLSFKCNDFLKMANLKTISSSATLIAYDITLLVLCPPHTRWMGLFSNQDLLQLNSLWSSDDM